VGQSPCFWGRCARTSATPGKEQLTKESTRDTLFVVVALVVVVLFIALVVQDHGDTSRTTSASPSARPSVAVSPEDSASPLPTPTVNGTPRPAVSYSRTRPPATRTLTGITPSTTFRAWPVGTIGWQFTPAVDIKVTALGCFDAHRDGLARAHRVGIFDAESKRLLASVTVRPKSRPDGFFRWESLKTPLVLEAERPCLVGTEDKKTLETLYTWHSWPEQVDWSPPGGHWAVEIGPPAPLRMYVSRPSQAAFTAPTVAQDLSHNPPWFSPNFKFVSVLASPTP
jgi:hypothetical protein